MDRLSRFLFKFEKNQIGASYQKGIRKESILIDKSNLASSERSQCVQSKVPKELPVCRVQMEA